MLGSPLLGGSKISPSNSRVFVYEISGLKQSDSNDGNSYPFRRSGSVFISVPYSRMNEEMQRISKMGGTIVNIQSLEDFQKTKESSADNSES
ncbi:MAG: phycobilisome linker polypeptide [Cyanobacteria bacterium J06621_8]